MYPCYSILLLATFHTVPLKLHHAQVAHAALKSVLRISCPCTLTRFAGETETLQTFVATSFGQIICSVRFSVSKEWLVGWLII